MAAREPADGMWREALAAHQRDSGVSIAERARRVAPARYRIRVVEPKLLASKGDWLAVRLLVRALEPEIPAARRRWLIERANLPGRTMTAVGGPRWWRQR